MQRAIYVDRVTPRDHLSYTRPAERSEGRADMIVLAQPRGQARCKMHDALQSVQAGVGGTTPDRRAVLEVGENVGLEKDFENFTGEVMTNFEE